MRSRGALLAFAFALSASFSGAEGARADKKELDMGLQFRVDAVKAAPKEPRNHFNLGLEYYNRGMLDKARDSLNQALKVNPKDKSAHADVDLDACQLLGDISLKQNNHAAAVRYFALGLKIDPRDPVCLFGRAQAYYVRGKAKSAERYFTEFAEMSGKDPAAAQFMPRALTYLGALAMERRDYAAAAGYFRRVIREYPKQSSEAVHNLGLVLMTKGDIALRAGDLGSASEAYDEAVTINPESLPALKSSGLSHYGLGMGELASGKPGKEHFLLAGRRFEAALRIQPEDFESTYTLGLTQYNLEEFGRMIDSYRKSVQLDPAHAGARFNLALALFRNREFAEAIRQAEEARRLQPKDKDAAQLLAGIFDEWKRDLLDKGAEAYTADHILKAIDYWRRLLEMSPHDPEARQRVETAEAELERRARDFESLGDAAYDRADIGEALLQWQKAAALKPGDEGLAAKLEKIGIAKRADSLRKQAEDQLDLGDYRTALELVQEALRIHPDAAAAKRLKIRIAKALDSGYLAAMAKAKAELKAGNLNAARNSLEHARRLDPGSQEVADRLQMIAKRIDESVASLIQRAETAARAGDEPAALEAYERILAMQPDNRDAAREVKKLTGKEANATVSAEQFKQLYKKGLNAYLSNDLIAAEKAWADALKIDPDNREVANYLERARLKLKKAPGRKS